MMILTIYDELLIIENKPFCYIHHDKFYLLIIKIIRPCVQMNRMSWLQLLHRCERISVKKVKI